MSVRGNIVKSGPTKEFFISMITRDIILEDAIIELIDNSIDGIKRLMATHYSQYRIDIVMNKDCFTITDNCGGIDLKTAQEYAFKFGRPSTAPKSGIETTGTFGIGMKRALFKMGKKFQVCSTSSKSRFILDIDVGKWVQKDDWDFNLSYFDENDHDISEWGTRITVDDLYPGISANCESNLFINNVIEKVQQQVGLEIFKGLQTYINNTKIEADFIKIVNDGSIKPYKEQFIAGDVEVVIIAGIAPMTDPELAGWYIYCNGRQIVTADKTSLTTWNDGENVKYHNDYAAFRGFVFFTSVSPDQLPWNTSKNGLDTSSNIYQTAQQHMKDAFKTIKGELKKIYSKEEDERTPILYDISQKRTEDINYYSAKIIQNNTVVNFVDNYIFAANRDPQARISYTKPKSQVDAMKKKMNVSSNRDVGIMAFEYYAQMEGLE